MTELTAAEYRRVTRIPDRIDRTMGKLERLLTEAQRAGYRTTEWREAWECLHSRFLTDPKLIDQAWEREVERARNSKGENT